MEIKLKSIHANVLNDDTDYVLSNLQARFEVGYNLNLDGSINLNYNILVGQENNRLMVLKCTFIIKKYDRNIEREVILEEAVKQLQDRVELILGMVGEEMGFNSSQEMIN